jgi:hypothetical protein
MPLNKPQTRTRTQTSTYTNTSSSLLLYVPEKKNLYLFVAGFSGKVN